MNILLDTNTFLWLRSSPKKIFEKVLSAYHDLENEIFLSMASILEIQIKQQLGNCLK
jgi:PIN domain nuclease of toxin-antitoxin system